MVQLAVWRPPLNIATSGNDIYITPRWTDGRETDFGGQPPNNIEWVWPFPFGGGGGSFWKGFRIIIYSQQGNGTATMSRSVNGIDVGTTLTLTNNQPPAVPTVFLDLVDVEINKFDKLSIRINNNFTGSTIPKVNFISFFEFPDGFWGF